MHAVLIELPAHQAKLAPEVRQAFSAHPVGSIAGTANEACKLLSVMHIRLTRDGLFVHEGKLRYR